MKKIAISLTAAAVTMLASAPAWAHHSAAQFDFQHTKLVTGKVLEARFANPHARLVLEVADDSGTREITYEGHSRNNMYREGFRPNMMEAGDTITIRIAPMKSGADGGYVVAVKTADGTEIGNVTGAD